MFSLYDQKKILRIGLLFSLIFTANVALYAQPNLQPLGENIADQGSAYYQFKIKKFYSTDQKTTYKVWLGIPKQLTSKAYAAIFMLDGNTVMARLNDDILKDLSHDHAPVLVAIGYDTHLPFETKARALDYTPAHRTGKIQPDPRNPERLTGGSTQFRELILKQIKPWVSQQIQIDSQRTALWGHSYGGLFVLDSFIQDAAFSHYFAASPSLSWAEQRILKSLEQTPSHILKNKKLVIMEGDISTEIGQKQSQNFDVNMIENNRQLTRMLDRKKAQTKLILYPNLSHGEVFQASLMDVLYNRLF
ncbi:alpha/beta hydrolase [Acinetobacter sp. Marseille-Q1618]|uniref:alpha/beta hydrolase n=1 Tax=Acinetobacter sp. Marseille-Q1618 TaxID=2697502 RepID=UPI00156EB48C|nr:alpha/beta hydrolase-fold protein [Acinetobacter sp. Marseille-Q1618]